MSHAEILAELPKLSPKERQELLERLAELQDQDICRGVSDWEKRLLDHELAEYRRDPDAGIPWREAIAQLRGPKRG